MTEMTLYFAPSTCARVPMIALEEIGVPFNTNLIRFMTGEHKSEEYRGVNPKGKVPALLVGTEVLTENVAILSYLNERFPAANLLPTCEDATTSYQQIADLCFCSTTLHPLVTRLRLPSFFAKPEQAPDIWAKASSDMDEYFQLVEDRLCQGDWWYGDEWSIMDAYLNWVFWRVEGAKFNVTPYPRFCDHAERFQQRPSVVRAMQREEEANQLLRAEGLEFVPPPLVE